jgi:hypothetical protein
VFPISSVAAVVTGERLCERFVVGICDFRSRVLRLGDGAMVGSLANEGGDGYKDMESRGSEREVVSPCLGAKRGE